MTYQSEVLADSPYLCWPLDETSGTTATDVSGNARHGTYSGTYTLDATELMIGSPAPQFNSDGVVIANSAASITAPYTFECWARLDDDLLETTIRVPIFGLETGDEAMISCSATAGFPAASLNPPVTGRVRGLTAYSNSQPTPLSARHYVFVVDTDGLDWYVDGTLYQTIAWDTSTYSFNDKPTVGNGGLVNAEFVGSVAWAALYDSALSAARVLAHYEAAPREFTDSDSATATDDGISEQPSETIDSFTATDTAELVVEMSDTDSGTATDADALTVEMSATDSAVASDVFAGGRVDPNISVADIAYAHERAVMSSNAAGTWPFSAPYDALILRTIYDFRDARVVLTETSDDIFDAIITNHPTSFTVPDWPDVNA